MKKLGLTIAIPLVMLALSACGSRQVGNQSSSSVTSSVTSSSITEQGESAKLDPHHLTPEQTVALVLYYGDAHMPGADTTDYSANMEKQGQTATVKIYDKDNVPRDEGPVDKNYPDGAEELYFIKLGTDDSDKGSRLNSIYYTVVGDKIYLANSNGGIRKNGVTPVEMAYYAKSHGEVSRVLNVAQNTRIIDTRDNSYAN